MMGLSRTELATKGGAQTYRPRLSAQQAASRLRAVASLLALVALWALVAVVLNDPLRAPGPQQVLPALWDGLVTGRMLPDLTVTLRRVGLAFLIAIGVGTAGGIILGLSPRLDRWLDPWLTVLNNIPALVTIVLCYLWIGLNETAAIFAVALNKIPLVTVMLREGVRVLDPDLNDMARLYRMPWRARLVHIILPQLAPQLMAAARAGISLIWKIVLVVEFLGRSNGIGFRIHLDFQMFDITGVLANALAFVAVMLAVEWLVLAPLAAHAARWRRT
ncbi:ABC transporter permease [Sinirhodobacter sp. WL0062]|uniref:ABC transporter permease n=1 Tax=Rhodobacter flavimaris TaxID=2907145 RepID=A0ABS8YUQ1_9RHOB|nr:ABC transporter permease [Sinirhodobacter sp. WL0062]MCE5972244.1 ABC transporter permease [Sinirhodobacter sp. WL0062]